MARYYRTAKAILVAIFEQMEIYEQTHLQDLQQSAQDRILLFLNLGHILRFSYDIRTMSVHKLNFSLEG